jgi:integrase
MQRLVETSKHDPTSQLYPFIVIDLATAMRTVEFLKIRREHIDIERQAIYVPAAKTSARAQPIKKARPIFWLVSHSS